MINLQETKEWLRVDYDEDDTQIQLLIDTAETYLRDSIDDFDIKLVNDKFKNKAKLVMLVLVTNWYDNREFTELNVDEKVRYTINSLIQQMKHGYYGDINE
ncbi:head-tail connector protein [Tissierella praeacuta]|uniref:head-tail connector protein n=1 Tax=Tissierella praeacuta TaxID=43131 RepID=UPI00333F0CEB